MKIIFLGTNGWYTDEKGNTACILIDSKDHYVVLDAGNGIYKLDKYITDNKPISLFLSHFHLDHVSGFHILPKFTFSQGLDIYMAEGRKKDFEALVTPPYTIGYAPGPKNIHDLRMQVRVHELGEGLQTSPFPLQIFEQFHAYRDHGYRFELEGKTLAYSGDCGITENSNKLSKNADVLIHECSLREKSNYSGWGHVDPTQAASLAKDAGVKRLLLTHFDPTQFPTLEDRKDAVQKAKEIFPETTAVVDDLVIEL